LEEKAKENPDINLKSPDLLDMALVNIRRKRTKQMRGLFTNEVDYRVFKLFPKKGSEIYRIGDYIVIMNYSKTIKREGRWRDYEIQIPARIGIMGINGDGKLFFYEIRADDVIINEIKKDKEDVNKFRAISMNYELEPHNPIVIDKEKTIRVQGDLVFNLQPMDDIKILELIEGRLKDAYGAWIEAWLHDTLREWLIEFLSKNRISCGERGNQIIVRITKCREIKVYDKYKRFQEVLNNLFAGYLKDRLGKTLKIGIPDISVYVMDDRNFHNPSISISIDIKGSTITQIIDHYYLNEINKKAMEIMNNPTELSLKYSNHTIYYKGIPQQIITTIKDPIEGLPTMLNIPILRSDFIVITDPHITIEHDEHGVNEYTIISEKKLYTMINTIRNDDTHIRNRMALLLLIEKYTSGLDLYKIEGYDYKTILKAHGINT
jgi:hypothetical protein